MEPFKSVVAPEEKNLKDLGFAILGERWKRNSYRRRTKTC
jgi:hypothetical protein